MKGYIHSLESFGAVDGPGIRYVVFMQGCPMRCLYCHNPDSWKLKDGSKMSVRELVNKIKSFKNYIKDGGVTISGGEPLLQSNFVCKLIKKLHSLQIHVAIDTSGCIDLKKSQKALQRADLILLDVKALEDKMHKQITSHSNKNPRLTLDFCEKINKPVWIRHVLLPGYTLDDNKLKDLAVFLKNYKCVQNIELLPFHKMGEYKWQNLGYKYTLYDTQSPTQDQVDQAKAIFKKHKLPVK